MAKYTRFVSTSLSIHLESTNEDCHHFKQFIRLWSKFYLITDLMCKWACIQRSLGDVRPGLKAQQVKCLFEKQNKQTMTWQWYFSTHIFQPPVGLLMPVRERAENRGVHERNGQWKNTGSAVLSSERAGKWEHSPGYWQPFTQLYTTTQRPREKQTHVRKKSLQDVKGYTRLHVFPTVRWMEDKTIHY